MRNIIRYRLGGRIAKIVRQVDGETVTYQRTDYQYGEPWQVLEERTDSFEVLGGEGGALETPAEVPGVQWLWDIRYVDSPVLRWRDADLDSETGYLGLEETLYACNDANMNVTALIDPAAGEAVERYVYDPYGKATVYDDDWSDTVGWSSSKKNEVLYCGYRFDPETGLDQVRFRYYHPTLGRWQTRDPIGYVDGLSLPRYCMSNPVDYRDALGLAAWTDWDLAGSAANAYATRAMLWGPLPNGWWANRAMDWLLGRMSLAAQVNAKAAKYLPRNSEVRAVVDSVMREYATMLCNDENPDEAAPLTYDGLITFHNQPMSGVFGTGTLRANGSGTWTRDDKCAKTCRRVHVEATWSYTDCIDMLSLLESQDRGMFSWSEVGPGVVVTGAVALVEGGADIALDKAQGASYDIVVEWSERLDVCCEELEP